MLLKVLPPSTPEKNALRLMPLAHISAELSAATRMDFYFTCINKFCLRVCVENTFVKSSLLKYYIGYVSETMLRNFIEKAFDRHIIFITCDTPLLF